MHVLDDFISDHFISHLRTSGGSPRSQFLFGLPHPGRQSIGLRTVHDMFIITYGPRKAVAEVSKDKEPIGKERAEFNWFESQLMSDSNALRFN